MQSHFIYYFITIKRQRARAQARTREQTWVLLDGFWHSMSCWFIFVTLKRTDNLFPNHSQYENHLKLHKFHWQYLFYWWKKRANIQNDTNEKFKMNHIPAFGFEVKRHPAWTTERISVCNLNILKMEWDDPTEKFKWTTKFVDERN